MPQFLYRGGIIFKGGEGYGFYRHIQQYFSYIVAVSFIGGGNRYTLREPPTCHKSLTNHITYCCIEYTTPVQDYNSQS
jgi:hypothetical protein